MESIRSIWKNPQETRQRDFDFSPSTVGRRYSAPGRNLEKSRRRSKERRLQSASLNHEDAKVAKERKEDLSRKKG
jgi:hypothetical protein